MRYAPYCHAPVASESLWDFFSMATPEELALTDGEESESPYASVQTSPRRLTSSSTFSRSKSWQRWRDSRGNAREAGSTSPINVTGEDAETAADSGLHAADSSHAGVRRARAQSARPSGPKHPRFNRMCSQRTPRGRAFVLILVMLVTERYMLYGAVDQVLDLIPELPSGFKSEGYESFLRIFLFYCVSRLFYPIGGFLADVYLGRCRVIHISLWLYWIAFALLTVANIMQDLGLRHINVLYTHVFPISAYVFVVLASGGFESTLIPFGADQLEAASSSVLSSYFYWYYIVIQIGPLLNIFVNLLMSTLLPDHADLMQVFVTLVVATIGLVLHRTLQHWYFQNALRENCIKLVLHVLWFAARVRRQIPQYRRAFRYGEGKIKRIDLAKRQYDGKFSGDQVEDVKTFCMVCFILFCLGGYFFSQSGVGVMLTYRINATLYEATTNQSGVYFVQEISSNLFFLLNITVGLLFVPLINHVFIPCFPSLTMRGRMAIGMAVNVVAIITAAAIEGGIRDTHTTPLQQLLLVYILPTLLVTLPEVLTTMAALEFVYAQSPESMKGMLTGLLYFIYGIFNGSSATLFYFFIQASSTYSYYYVMLLVLAVLGLIAYTIAACVYVNRQRPTPEHEDNGEETRLFYDNLVIPKSHL